LGFSVMHLRGPLLYSRNPSSRGLHTPWPEILQGNRCQVDFGKALREYCALVRHSLLLRGYHRRAVERKPKTPGIFLPPIQIRTGVDRNVSQVTEQPRGNSAPKLVAPLSQAQLRKTE